MLTLIVVAGGVVKVVALCLNGRCMLVFAMIMLLQGGDGGVDEDGLVADDAQRHPGRQRLPDVRELGLDGLDDLDGVCAGLTAHVERWNNTLRQRVGRFVRKSLSFSKSDTMHELCLRLFLHDYNKSLALSSDCATTLLCTVRGG